MYNNLKFAVMKKKNFFWSLFTIVLLAMPCISFVSCSKDDKDDELEQTENISNQDPEGTIVLNMSSGASDDWKPLRDSY